MNGLDLLAVGYVVLVELAPIPQMVRLQRKREADQVSVTFLALLAFGRFLAIPSAFASGAVVLGWGFVAGAALRMVLTFQTWHFQRRARQLQEFRDQTVSI